MSEKPSFGPSRFWIWLFRGALLCQPYNLRLEYGGEMEEVFRTRVARAKRTTGKTGLLSFQLRELRGLLRTGLASRWESRFGHGSSGKKQRQEPPRESNRLIGGLASDIRLAIRGLRKAPGFTLSAVLILALGIGANVTAFTALKVATLTPPPFLEPERMVSVDLTRTGTNGTRISRWAYPYLLMLSDWPDRLVDPVADYRDGVATLTGFGPASELPTEVVSPGYFDVVGLPMTMGRGFVAEEAYPSGPYRVTVVSYSFWRTRLGGETSALGREIELNGELFQVVGVAPEGFSGFTGRASLWVPHGAYAVFQPGVLQQAGNHVAWVVGRLRPGASFSAAAGQMEVIGSTVAEEWPREDSYGAGLRSFEEVWTNPEAREASKFLAMAAGFVLLVACANLAGLLFTRARRRMREGAMKRALGASRWRIIRSYLVESLTIATLGGLAGIALSVWGMRLLAAAWPTQFLEGENTGLQVINPDGLTFDAKVIAFAIFVSLVTALLIGLIPALRISSFRITDHLKDGGAGTEHHGGRAGLDPQALLVGAQVSLALILLVGVGLMGSTVNRLLAVDEGFDTERLLSFNFSSPQAVPRLNPYDENAWRDHITLSAQFDDRFQQRLEALPGIEGTTMYSGMVLTHFEAVLGVMIDDAPEDPDRPGSIGVVPVSDNYFELLDIPLISGRVFNQSDGFHGPPAVVLSQTAARVFFPDSDPIGKRLTTYFSVPGRASAEVVGVVGDVLFTDPDQVTMPVAYYSLRERRFGSSALVRTTGDPNNTIGLIREELFALDPTVAMSNITTMNQIISRSVGDSGLIFWLLMIFASITILLAAVGTWGVVAYSIAIREKELGLRIALGAESKRVLGLVLRKSTFTAGVGVVVGLAGAWASTRVLETFLWNTSARDPRIFVGGSLLLLAVVLLASYVPARRATRVNPVEVLRGE